MVWRSDYIELNELEFQEELYSLNDVTKRRTWRSISALKLDDEDQMVDLHHANPSTLQMTIPRPMHI